MKWSPLHLSLKPILFNRKRKSSKLIEVLPSSIICLERNSYMKEVGEYIFNELDIKNKPIYKDFDLVNDNLNDEGDNKEEMAIEAAPLPAPTSITV